MRVDVWRGCRINALDVSEPYDWLGRVSLLHTAQLPELGGAVPHEEWMQRYPLRGGLSRWRCRYCGAFHAAESYSDRSVVRVVRALQDTGGMAFGQLVDRLAPIQG